MKLQTTIPFKPERNQIDYSSKVLLLGSCFAENIGAKLNYFKFQNTLNPFGILFHPIAIERGITRALNEVHYTEEDVFFENERWHCFEAHSQLSSVSKETLLEQLNAALHTLKQSLEAASHIVLTFGTAWVYRFIETDAIVANCHKVPQRKFLKELLTPSQIEESILAIEALVRDVNPNVNFIYTVSPVRHIKDGIVENSRSKAHLLAGVHQAVAPRKHNYYFPSFEIQMDELRDYRFYEEDLLHPTNTAITIIWEHFKTVWISSETLQLQKEIDFIQKGLQHRSFNPDSLAHKEFELKLKEKITVVESLILNCKFS
ncbi:GSCFA domain-containing protein [Patiriisocius marinus]|uniref:GSCFA domain-containing protein n=1 Tax=Patiriisocius marinus TaxID=1397112 RepID=UPI00232E7F71|nr:GSCFA domain-containing protein [Patiriisocius marinus]